MAAALACAVAAALAGCSSPPPATFDLSAAPRPAGVGPLGLIVIAEPSAVALLDSDRITVRAAGNAVAYLPGAQWPDRLPKLVQARLIQSFENASRVGSVGRPGERLVAQNQLNTEIRAFEVQETTREAVVEITAKIVNDRTGRIIAAELFAVRVPVAAIDGPGAAQALNEAHQDVLARIVRWAAGRT